MCLILCCLMINADLNKAVVEHDTFAKILVDHGVEVSVSRGLNGWDLTI